MGLMDIDVIARAVSSGLATAERSIVTPDIPLYRNKERNLQGAIFRPPYEPVLVDLVPADESDMGARILVGLDTTAINSYILAQVSAAATDNEAIEGAGSTFNYLYNIDLYVWRDEEHPESVERKLLVLVDNILRALREADYEWEFNPTQIAFGFGSSDNSSYRVATITVPAAVYRD